MSAYGLIVVSLIVISALLMLVTPIGNEFTTGINQIIDKYTNSSSVEEITNNREDIEKNPGGEIKKTITLHFVYDNGQEIIPAKKITYNYGSVVDISAEMPQIEGYTPNYIPPEQTITKDLNYTFTYSPKQYSITYELNGGAIVGSQPTKYIYGETTLLPNKVIKEGYTFVGWYTDEKFTGEPISKISPSEKDDIKIYARWENTEYKITYISNAIDITEEIDGIKGVVYGQPKDLPILPSSDTVYFAGWYDNESLKGSQITTTPLFPNDDLVYYAKWTNSGYSITYVLNGGYFPSTPPNNYAPGSTIELPKAYKEGCHFRGWSTSNTVFREKSKINSDDTGDIKLYAMWTPATYNIHYNTQEGYILGEYESQYKYYNTNISPQIPGNSVKYPTNVIKTGYRFTGWVDSVKNIQVTQTEDGMYGDIYLIAQYEKVSYRLIFNTNEGNAVSPTYKSLYLNEKYGLLPTPTRQGYVFEGWYTAKQGGVKVSSETKLSSAQNTTIYARWTPQQYNISYVLNQGNWESSPISKYTYGVPCLLPRSNALSRDYYSFDGWYTDKDFAPNSKLVSIPTTQIGNITLYAKWNPNTYTITYNTQGGTISGTHNTTYIYGSTTLLPTPQRENYVFIGWKKANDTSNNYIFSISPTDHGDLSLVAVWKKTTGVSAQIVLFDHNQQAIRINGSVISCILNGLEIGVPTTIPANYFTEQSAIDDTYYHDAVTFTITEDTEQIEGLYHIPVSVSPYRKLILNSVTVNTNAKNDLYTNNLCKLKLEDNVTNLNIIQNASIFTFIDKLEYNNTRYTTAEFINYLKNSAPTTTPYNVKVLYNEKAFNVSYNEESIKNTTFITPKVEKYYSSQGLTLPTVSRNCVQFDVWECYDTDNVLIKDISTLYAQDVILKPTWVETDVEKYHPSWRITKPATCTTEGEKVCNYCQRTISTLPNGHNWTNAPYKQIDSLNPISGYVDNTYVDNAFATDYHYSICTECNSANKLELHNWEYTQIPNSTQHTKTCTTNGCKYQIVEEHIQEIVSSNNSVHTYRCPCSSTQITEFHKFIITDSSEDTHTYSCEICHYSYTEDHDWQELTPEQSDTFADNPTHYCTVCEKTKNPQLPYYIFLKLPNDWTLDKLNVQAWNTTNTDIAKTTLTTSPTYTNENTEDEDMIEADIVEVTDFEGTVFYSCKIRGRYNAITVSYSGISSSVDVLNISDLKAYSISVSNNNLRCKTATFVHPHYSIYLQLYPNVAVEDLTITVWDSATPNTKETISMDTFNNLYSLTVPRAYDTITITHSSGSSINVPEIADNKIYALDFNDDIKQLVINFITYIS